MIKSDLSKFNLPDTPGVYFFRDGDKSKDKDGNIIYIGKATYLKSRVRSYFAPDLADKRGFKIVNMVLAAENITFIETASVLEALLLENKLIKEHQPIFNTREKDDKSYTCVVITKEDFPRVLVMRIRDYEKRFVVGGIEKVDKVYGPFSYGEQIRTAMKIIRKIFPYRDKCEVGQGKPCFNAQVKLCPGPCAGLITKSDYKNNIKHIKDLFDGNRVKIKKELVFEMNTAAKEERFERARVLRDTIYALDHIRDVALIKDEDVLEFKTSSYRIEAYDVAHISGSSRVGVMTVVIDDKKDTNEYRKFKLIENVNDDYMGIVELIKRRFRHPEWAMPNIIVIDGGVGQKNIAEQALSSIGKNIRVVSVVKDDKHKAKDILGIENIIGQKVTVGKKEKKVEHERLKKSILLANLEAHRFAITYHKLRRGVDNFI